MLSILLWELVDDATRGAGPSLVAEIYLTIRVQNCSACFALNCRIINQGHILDFLERRVKASDRNDYACGIHFIARPVIPGKSDAVTHLSVITLVH